MKHLVLILVFGVMVSGCTGTNIRSLSKDLEKPIKGSKIDFFLIADQTNVDPGNSTANEEAILSSLGQNVADLLNTECNLDFDQQDGQFNIKSSPVWIPLITSFGKYVFDKYQDGKLRDLNALKEASQNSYSGRTFASSADLQKTKCAVLIRYTEVVEKIANRDIPKRVNGLVAILKLEHYQNNKAFSFTPIYLSAESPTVLTKKDYIQGGKLIQSSINTAIAFSVKAILDDENKLPSLAAVGASSVSVSKVQLSAEPKNHCQDEKCPQSDLIPHISTGTIASVSMSVTETGNTGIAFDALAAEIKAIKEAYGPAIKDSLKEYLSKDD